MSSGSFSLLPFDVLVVGVRNQQLVEQVQPRRLYNGLTPRLNIASGWFIFGEFLFGQQNTNQIDSYYESYLESTFVVKCGRVVRVL